MIPVNELLTPRKEASTLDRPLDHLSACHRRIEERLATLERIAAGGDSAEAREALARVYAFMDSNGAMHTVDEEESLFPRLRPLLSDPEAELLTELEREHDVAEGIYERLRHASDGDFPALVASLCAHYRQHIAHEEEVLIPLAKQRLAEADVTAIAAEMKGRRGQR